MGRPRTMSSPERTAVLCIVVVSLVGCILCAWPWVRYVQFLSSVRTPCTIVTSELRQLTSGGNRKSPSYDIAVCYDYEWQGQRLRSREYDIRWGSSFVSKAKRDAVLALSPGAQSVCWVNSRNPQDAVLDPNLTATHAVIALPGGFLLLGSLALRHGIVAKGESEDQPPAMS